MIFTAYANGWFQMARGVKVRCALGKGGVKPAAAKREGDGASPIGVWPIRRVLYRADKTPRPRTHLPVTPIMRNDGWCDAPTDPMYNRPVSLPFRASAEHMWRDDDVYDLVMILGHNDSPVRPYYGSAIFLHCARPGYKPTEGCVALAKPDVIRLLTLARPGDGIAIVG